MARDIRILERPTGAVEWLTLALIVVVHLLFAGVTWFFHDLPLIVTLPALTVLVALHSSLQHEAIHGHPTRRPILNELMMSLPLGLIVPYGRYKTIHLRHHRDARLTDPYDDPESFYRASRDWAETPPAMKRLLGLNNTLLGRLIIGPALWWPVFLASEMRLARHSRRMILRAWLPHLAGIAVLAAWGVGVCGISPLTYLLGVAYPGAALIMLRSFAEHQAARGVDERTAIVESNRLMGLLFLNNNLHFAHHKYPRAPWYRLPAIYRREASEMLSANGGYRFPGYFALIRRHLLRAKEPVAHPYI